MSNEFKRSDRIAGLIQRKLAEIIPQEVKDPRLPAFITISGVKVSGDLKHAKVYFTVLNHDPAETAVVLNAAASFLRTALGRTLTIRSVPLLQFIYDESIEYARKLSKLMDDVLPDENDGKTSD